MSLRIQFSVVGSSGTDAPGCSAVDSSRFTGAAIECTRTIGRSGQRSISVELRSVHVDTVAARAVIIEQRIAPAP